MQRNFFRKLTCKVGWVCEMPVIFVFHEEIWTDHSRQNHAIPGERYKRPLSKHQWAGHWTHFNDRSLEHSRTAVLLCSLYVWTTFKLRVTKIAYKIIYSRFRADRVRFYLLVRFFVVIAPCLYNLIPSHPASDIDIRHSTLCNPAVIIYWISLVKCLSWHDLFSAYADIHRASLLPKWSVPQC